MPHDQQGCNLLAAGQPAAKRGTARAWFRFGIRDALWAMVVVGLALGWWREYQIDREREAYLNRAENIRSYVESFAFPRSDTNMITVTYTDGTVVEMPYDLPPRR